MHLEPTVDIDLSPQGLTRERVLKQVMLGVVVLTCVTIVTIIAALLVG